MPRARRHRLLGILLLLTCLVGSLACGPPARGDDPTPGPPPEDGPAAASGWDEVERLISEDKLQAAADLVAELRHAARQAGDADGWTRGLIKEVQLRTALHGYETAVRFLEEQPWPERPLYRTVLHLFYGQSLVTYLRAYSWEINQRERVAGDDEVDLKAWTREQIFAAAQEAYLAAWHQRDAWGSEPVGRLAEYLQQNNYPPRIRGTLRDAVTYLWVELLADSSLWSPEHSNEIYRLDLASLVAGVPAASREVKLDRPEVHPLVKIGAVLDDLEAWHGGNARPEAAFEARRQRLLRLWQSFTRADDRRRIRRNLEEHLRSLGSRYEWWSMGQATLAELVRDEGEPDSLVEARRLALIGERAHPGSVGAQRCRHIVAAIEAPSFSLHAMSSDGLGRRSLQVSHKNLPQLYFRAYRLDLVEVIEASQDYNMLPGYREVREILRRQDPVARWGTELPETPDYRSHRTYVTPPLESPGLHLVVASARRDFAEPHNRRSAANLIVGDLVLLTREEQGGYEVTVRSGSSGRRLSGAEVLLYRYDYRQGHRRVESLETGSDGVVRFTPEGRQSNAYFVLARRGEEVALDPSYLRFHRRGGTGAQSAALIYTDRSIYRPQQEVLWKVVAYRGRGEEGRFNTLPGTSLTVELLDPNREVVASRAVTTNDFGTASGRFRVPVGRLLGRWALRASLGGESAIRVEEYKRPTFEVQLSDPEAALRLNRPATLEGEARYYFGLPVVSGDVTWQVSREPVYPRWWYWYYSPVAQAQTVAAGATELDADGRFRFTFEPEADEREAGSRQVTYRYRVNVHVTDEGGETRSASRVMRLGFVAVEARLESATTFFRAGQPVRFTFQRSDLDGVPRPGAGSWRLLELEQPARALLPAEQPLPPRPAGQEEGYQTQGDRKRPRWATDYNPEAVLRQWADGKRRHQGRVRHDADGEAEVVVEGLPAGAYRLRYTTTDDFGAAYETSREFLVVADGSTRLALPAVLQAERGAVPVGGVARLLVHSALPEQEMVLEIFRSGRRTERRLLGSMHGLWLLEIPIEERHRGGFGVRLSCLRDHQLMSFTTSVFVPWHDRRLHLEFATFRDRLRPGATETWRVTVRGDDQETVQRGAAEVLAYMYDRSLDLFTPHQPPDPLRLYPSRTAAGQLRSALGSGGEVWIEDRGLASLPGYPHLRGDSLKSYSGYGIGGLGRRGIPMPGEPVVEAMALRAEAPLADAEGEVRQRKAAELEEETITVSAAEAPAEEAPAELRTDFSETAFWHPHLLTGSDGSVSFELTVPDSVTEWSVWVHAVTRDLRAGSLERRTKSVKELMVRPYLPRFLREGDKAHLRVVVNNAGEATLEGRLVLDILDPESGQSVLAEFGLAPEETSRSFSVPPGGGSDVAFVVQAPARPGPVAFKVVARAGSWSDGEQRPVPVLPGRVHLAQSRFATLQNQDRRILRFADLAADDDPTRIHDQLVVTLDGQLFYSVLSALPYLVNYPYECTEQILNRFLSTGIVSSLYDDYPVVARMAEKLSRRETRLETWEAKDPNRKMLLEETPWLRQAQGGGTDELINVLDPRLARAQRQASLAKLRKAQTSLGGFPWWPGGPPSPYMTLYLLHGFSKALEFGIEVPKEMVVAAWGYMHRHYLDEIVRNMMAHDCCWEMVTFLNYVLSSYPDDSWTGGVFSAEERRQMLDFSFRHWRRHSPLLKAYLALTLERAGRHDDAGLVFDSIMDSAKTTQDLGTYWAPEDRAWLWYNDTIETHAFALRALMELEPDDARRHGLVQWLLLNKKLNHWKSTRATAEVIYALVHYLEREGALAVREEATVALGPRVETFVFEPDEYTGQHNRIVIPGPEIDPEAHSRVVVEKETPGFLFASATWHFSTERLPAEARGDLFGVSRRYFRRFNTGQEWVLEPLEEGARLVPGDQVEVHLSLRARHAAEYVHLRDPRGAGFEPESTVSRYKWDLGIGWYEEVRDSGTNFFFEWLPAGEYTFKYRLRANVAGTFRAGPATVQSMYAPEFTAYSSGRVIEIGGR